MRPVTALPVLERIDQAFQAAPPVPCRAGCTACCHGPFDISPADALTVAEGMMLLDDRTRTRLIDHANDEIIAFQRVRPDWKAPYAVMALGDADFDAIADIRAAAPCPALDTFGACAIYRHRPSTCRLMGRAWTAEDGGMLANACPIQDAFPGYADMPAAPIQLDKIEAALEHLDALSAKLGFVTTTVAGAIMARATLDP
ncbi:MAG: YkgJ family cysteine cluster protein [Gemmatimonadales bacterium]